MGSLLAAGRAPRVSSVQAISLPSRGSGTPVSSARPETAVRTREWHVCVEGRAGREPGRTDALQPCSLAASLQQAPLPCWPRRPALTVLPSRLKRPPGGSESPRGEGEPERIAGTPTTQGSQHGFIPRVSPFPLERRPCSWPDWTGALAAPSPSRSDWWKPLSRTGDPESDWILPRWPLPRKEKAPCCKSHPIQTRGGCVWQRRCPIGS